MINQHTLVTLFLAGALLLYSGTSVQAAKKTSTPKPSSQMLKAEIGAFGVLTDTLQADLGIKCKDNGADGVCITDVHLGTEAAYSGLQVGDRVVDAEINGDEVAININRDGHVYQVRLRILKPGAVNLARIGNQNNSQNNNEKNSTDQQQRMMRFNSFAQDNRTMPTPLIGDAKKLKLLASYNLELIVDRSKSMGRRDCPGGLSRWEWCGQQAGDLAQALAPYAPKGLTMIPFASQFEVYEHATPQNISSLFNTLELQLGTRLFEPLSARLDPFIAAWKPGQKPLLIAIITDGVPFPNPEPDMVKNELIQASQRMTSPTEVTVVFFQIGNNDRFGAQYLADLDQNLVSDGARFPYVHTKSFDELTAIGLGQALAEAIQQFGVHYEPAEAPAKPKSTPHKSSKSPASSKHKP